MSQKGYMATLSIPTRTMDLLSLSVETIRATVAELKLEEGRIGEMHLNRGGKSSKSVSAKGSTKEPL